MRFIYFILVLNERILITENKAKKKSGFIMYVREGLIDLFKMPIVSKSTEMQTLIYTNIIKRKDLYFCL